MSKKTKQGREALGEFETMLKFVLAMRKFGRDILMSMVRLSILAALILVFFFTFVGCSKSAELVFLRDAEVGFSCVQVTNLYFWGTPDTVYNQVVLKVWEKNKNAKILKNEKTQNGYFIETAEPSKYKDLETHTQTLIFAIDSRVTAIMVVVELRRAKGVSPPAEPSLSL